MFLFLRLFSSLIENQAVPMINDTLIPLAKEACDKILVFPAVEIEPEAGFVHTEACGCTKEKEKR